MQHLIVESVKKTKTEKKDGYIMYSVNMKGETPNSLITGSLTLKSDEEDQLEEFNPEIHKIFRLKLEEVKDEEKKADENTNWDEI